jgi:transcriptional regulator NrdR family protein
VIPCPKCGGDTGVRETRKAPVGIRRRRVCSASCGGKVTTYELAVFGGEVVPTPPHGGKR